MKWKIGFLIAMLACSAAQAEVYQWTDIKGVVHFTDDLDTVPPTYRNKVIKKGSANPDNGVKPAVRETPPVAPVRQQARDYGGHDEQWWRTRLESARREVMAAREQLAAKKDTLTELHHKRVVFQKPSDRAAYNALSEEVSRDEDKLQVLEDGLAKLKAEVENLGIRVE